jgi:hypothetical protein
MVPENPGNYITVENIFLQPQITEEPNAQIKTRRKKNNKKYKKIK